VHLTGRLFGGVRLRLPVIIASTVLTVSCASLGLAFTDADDADQVVDSYLVASKIQQEALRGVQMDVDIDAQLPKLKQKGKLKVLRMVSKVGKITYHKLGEFVGDQTVKNEVIERYLAAEQEGRENGSIAITRANYKFKLKAKLSEKDQLTQADQRIYIFELTPKKKKVGLFKGELWLDVATGMPLRESGELVKNPSFFLKKVEFVRDYEIKDGVSVPVHIESKVDTKLVGTAELSINYSNYTHRDLDANDADTTTAP
jgi:hypothetical protein